MVNRERMEAQLILHEGLRTKSYLDTEGYWTVGVGYNISGRGVDFLERITGRKFRGIPYEQITLTRDEALAVLRADIDRVEKAVRTYFPEYDELNEVRQRVCVDMAFNLGFKALSFKKTIAWMKVKHWSNAAREMWKSKWSGQVGDGPGGKRDRADRLTEMMLTGLDYTS